MKSKQEVIQEAYDNTFPDSGNYSFDKIRSAVDENGWYRFNNDLKVNICTTGFDHDKGAYRPQSLRGIENNRGWTRIESEADLPTSGMKNYMYCVDGKPSVFVVNLRVLLSLSKDGIVSHYMALPSPEAPIY